jgi:hypothetical protein
MSDLIPLPDHLDRAIAAALDTEPPDIDNDLTDEPADVQPRARIWFVRGYFPRHLGGIRCILAPLSIPICIPSAST